MSDDSGGGPDDRDRAVGPDDDSELEPEVVRWLQEYADATDGRGDSAVAAILDEMNRLLRRQRARDSDDRADYGSRLRVLSEHLPVVLWTTDTDLNVTSFAGGGLAHVEVRPSSGVSLPLADLIGTSGAGARAMDAHVRALRGAPDAYEFGWRSRSYLAHVEPLRDPDGAIAGTVGLAIDVTERTRAERELARREAQLAEAQRLAHVGSWDRDIATGRLTWSDELYRIYGLEPQEIPASYEAFLEHVHPDDAGRVRAINEAAIRSGRSFEYQARIRRPDGEVRHYHARCVVVREASGRPRRLVGAAQDITERVRAEEARAVRRERRARLDGMLFAARELASRVTRNLAAAPEADDGPRAGSPAPSLDEAIDAATDLACALDHIAELQRQIPPE